MSCQTSLVIRQLAVENSLCQSRGLVNAPGDNNCFLNSAVQIFWHLDLFRRGFRKLRSHVCAGSSCTFCGIKVNPQRVHWHAGRVCQFVSGS